MSRYGSHQVFYTAGITNEWPPWGYERVPNFIYTLLRGGRALVPPPGTNYEMKVDIIIQGYSYVGMGGDDGFIIYRGSGLFMLVRLIHRAEC